MDCVILVDNSNIFIEGQKCSAIRKGMTRTSFAEMQPVDVSWRIDFEKLLSQLADGRKIRKAFLVGSRPPPKDNVWKMAANGGFAVITHERDSKNKEKAVDTELVARGTLAMATTLSPAALIIASEDRDFIPLVNVAHELNWTVEMAAFSTAFSPDGDMAIMVDKVQSWPDKLGQLDKWSFCLTTVKMAVEQERR